MIDESDWLRISRYIANEGTEEERRETARWVAAVPARAELVRQLCLGWEHAIEPAESVDVERAWGEVGRRKAVRAFAESARAAQVRRPLLLALRPAPRRWLWRVAAAAVVTLGAGSIWWGVTTRSRPVIAAADRMRVVTTRPGQTADVYLSDGTHVRLGAASALRFPTTFGADRHVYLDGEGYFDVVHESRREFAVYTARAVVRDIGTRFNVRAYRGTAGDEVVVTDGAVALKPAPTVRTKRGEPDSVLLRRSDIGRVNASGALEVAHGVNTDDYLAWMQGRLVFADVTLRQVLPELRRWYGADFTLGAGALADVRLTATFELGSLEDVLRRLPALVDARIERHRQAFVLYPVDHRPH